MAKVEHVELCSRHLRDVRSVFPYASHEVGSLRAVDGRLTGGYGNVAKIIWKEGLWGAAVPNGSVCGRVGPTFIQLNGRPTLYIGLCFIQRGSGLLLNCQPDW